MRSSQYLHSTLGLAALVCFGFLLTLAPSASAKEAIGYFGTEAGTGAQGGQFQFIGDIAVNATGAGSANRGEIYVADNGNHRIQRFSQDDNGTPGDPYDDKYEFVAAWGANVDSIPADESDYEICTVASECTTAAQSGGNGTPAGNGSLDSISGIAVDQDTGDVYVADNGNNRINVYAGDGAFLRSLGWDVVEGGTTGFEVCAAVDTCKTGTSGAGMGQIGQEGGIALSPPDGNASTGTIYLADPGNHRVDTYELDGDPPASIGSSADFPGGPEAIAIDSRGILYATEFSSSTAGRIVDRFDTQNADGGGVGPLAPIGAPPLVSPLSGARQIAGIEVDPDSDGAGPDKDVLYVLSNLGPEPKTVIQQFGPENDPGLTTPPAADDAEHGSVALFNFVGSLGFDEGNGRLFIGDGDNIGGAWQESGGHKAGVYVLDEAGGQPTASLDSLSNITATDVTLHGSVNPNGPPAVSYHFEYSTDGSTWLSTPNVVLGSQEGPQSIDSVLNPGVGLQPNTLYHVRLVAAKAFAPSVTTPELTFTTLPASPFAETTGTALRTATTARLAGAVIPRNSATTFHFEYGALGPCDSNPCASTPDQSLAAGNVTKLVAESVNGLQPGTTYHYRVVANNGNPGSPAFGEDMTVTTRLSDAPLGHGHYPGPPGSDRAYELVTPPDTSGNPIWEGIAVSSDGNHSLYKVAGGIPGSATGSLYAFYFATRTPSGWRTESVTPPRDRLLGSALIPLIGAPDLSSFVVKNENEATEESSVWRATPGQPPVNLNTIIPPQHQGRYPGTLFISKNPLRVFERMHGGAGFDPDHPEAAAYENLYEITSGVPRLVGLLPGDLVPPCGVGGGESKGSEAVSPDGSHVFFMSNTSAQCLPTGSGDSVSNPQLYVRDLESETTTALPGFESLIDVHQDAAYFWSKQRLSPEDVAPQGAAGEDGDIYKYSFDDGTAKCLTCFGDGIKADVVGGTNNGDSAHTVISEDGSRIYFQSRSPEPLTLGAEPGIDSNYVLDVATGELHWLGSHFVIDPRFISRDGTVALFSSSAASLNPQGGLSNGGTEQVFRYDDRDHSLVCVTCPQNGSAPAYGVNVNGALSLARGSGDVVAFATPNPLLSADQNTASPTTSGLSEFFHAGTGLDVYEWRDGRLFLVTNGLQSWPEENGTWPTVTGLGDDGRDLQFSVSARYTPDALDSYKRIYDARIGGGFEYPQAPPPCPLEVCQGIPKGAPEESAPGTATLAGSGNRVPAPSAKRHKKKHGKKKHKKLKHRTNHKRRASR